MHAVANDHDMNTILHAKEAGVIGHIVWSLYDAGGLVRFWFSGVGIKPNEKENNRSVFHVVRVSRVYGLF